MIRVLLAFVRRVLTQAEILDEPHVAEHHFAAWDADRRERQLAAFVVARSELAAHGISDSTP